MSPTSEATKKPESKKAIKKAKKAVKKSMQRYIEYATAMRGLSEDSKIHPVYYNEIPSNNSVFIEWSDGDISNFRKLY